MIKKFFKILTLSVLLVHTAAGFAGLADIFNYKKKTDVPMVKVLIKENAEGALLEVKGRGYTIYNPQDNSRLGTRFFGKRYYVQPLKNGLKWGEFFPKTYQIMLVPDDDSTTLLVDGKEYQGHVYVYQANSRVHIINELPVEAYLKSILSNSVEMSYSDEALAALAITARTELAFFKQKPAQKFWDFSANEHNYQGYVSTFRPFGVDEAVSRTRGMVLSTQLENQWKPFLAKWTEHSGGKTASLMAVFRNLSPVPYFSIETPFAAMDREKTSWEFQYPLNRFANLVGLSSISNIETYVDPESEKVYALRVFNPQQSKDIEVSQLRKWLGEEQLLSNDFNVKVQEDSVKFSGFGKGHGVGLCLFSADVMAKQGMNAKKILTHFFPNTQIHLFNDHLIVKGQPQEAPSLYLE